MGEYLVELEEGGNFFFDDDEEPRVRYAARHEGRVLFEVLLFRGGSEHDFILAFADLPYVNPGLGLDADVLCQGRYFPDAGSLLRHVSSLKGLRSFTPC